MRPAVCYGRPVYVIDASHVRVDDIRVLHPGAIIRVDAPFVTCVPSDPLAGLADLEQLIAGD